MQAAKPGSTQGKYKQNNFEASAIESGLTQKAFELFPFKVEAAPNQEYEHDTLERVRNIPT